VAREALDRMAVPAAITPSTITPSTITAAVDAFTDQYVSKDRCPADDLLEDAS
jgi:hypothetical protein